MVNHEALSVIPRDSPDTFVNIGGMAPGLQQTKASNYAIYELLAHFENGSIRIPRFQRGQRWGASDAAKLFDSVYKGYPVGTLLLWKRPAPEAEVILGSIRIRVPERTDALWVVDGQQRITALATALLEENGGIDNGRALFFDLDKERFGWRRQSGPHSTLLPVRGAHKLPRVMAWLRERNLDGHLQERAFQLADQLRNYRIPAYAVETGVEGDLASLREIFDRINTFGKRMTRAEVFHALTASETAEGRDLPYLSDQISLLGVGALRDSTLMMCVLSLDGADVLRDFRTEFANDSERLSKVIDRAGTAISRTVTFLREDAGVPHLDLVPYQHLMVALVRYFSLYNDPSQWERVLLRRWYWRAAVYGPLPKLGSTGTLRLALNTIDGRSAIQTVLALLKEFPCSKRRARADRMHWNRADTKTSLCALANRNPLYPAENGEEPIHLDVGLALSTNREKALPRVFASASGNLASSLANRVFWQPGRAMTRSQDTIDPENPEEIEQSQNADTPANPEIALSLAGPEVLASHVISESSVAALRRGDANGFFEDRYADIQRTVEDFVDARAEWDHPDRLPLASM